jgi:hypothetical protein
MARMRQTEALLQDAHACVMAARLRLEELRLRDELDAATNENPMEGEEAR